MSSATDTQGPVEPTGNVAVRDEGWGIMLFAGVLIAILGLIAVLAPFLTTVSLSLLLGVLLVVGGVTRLLGSFRSQGWGGVVWHVLIGLIAIGAGVFVFVNPIVGVATLTVIVISYLLVAGTVELAMGIHLRGTPNWGWSVASGAISLVLAVLLLLGLPSSALWAVGLLFGINLLAGGISMAVVALGGRRAPEAMVDRTAGAGGV